MGNGGIAVGTGFKGTDDFSEPRRTELQSSPSFSSSATGVSPPQSSTQMLIPTPGSGCISTSGPCLPRLSRSICSLLRATIKSSARGVLFGGSSRICSQPTGGEPGGEMRKFFSSAGGRSRSGLANWSSGVGSARNTRRTTDGLVDVCDVSKD